MKSLTHVYCHTCICALRKYFLLFFFKIYPTSDLFCQLHYCHFGPWTFSRWKPLTGILPFAAPNYPPCSRATEQLEWCFHNINQTKITFRTLNDSSFNQIRPKSLQLPTRLCEVCPLTPHPQLHCQVHLISFLLPFVHSTTATLALFPKHSKCTPVPGLYTGCMCSSWNVFSSGTFMTYILISFRSFWILYPQWGSL